MNTNQVLTLLKIASWIIFVGFAIKAGAMLVSFSISLLINPDASKDLYLGLDLHDIYQYSQLHYISMGIFIILIAALKAYLLYWVIKIFSKINIVHPFSQEVVKWLMAMSNIALQIGVLVLISTSYSHSLTEKGLNFSYDGGDAEFLLLAGILFIVAHIFKKGIEIQSENELTV
ncbi:DUF2975 domain-containing protein [Albibacterium profundi]|uniref:DUF2975 domain-containing protein n=1 Tax=Albibacterium profundi TaxID=3134906 RepID=A0ABV5CFZ4_9SPHI